MTKTSTLLSLCLFLSLTALHAQSTSLTDWLAEQQIEVQVTDDGLYYAIHEEGNGKRPESGDYVMMKYTGRLLDGTVFDESDPSDPFVFQLGYRQVILGWELGVPLLSVGSKASLYVPSLLAYGKRGVGKQIPPNADLQYEVELLKVMNFQEYDRYMIELEERERQAFERHRKQQFLVDKKIIQEFALDHKIKAKRTKSGMSYALTKKGKGEPAQAGDILEVQYKGQLVDGSVFDATEGKSTYRFTLGEGKVIQGWEEGFRHFKKGSEGWLLIPSGMAYGPLAIEEDGISIPANSVLIFKVKVNDIRQQVANR